MEHARMIGYKIKQERHKLGLSELELSTHIGLSPQEVQELENGDLKLTVKCLAKIAALFKKRLRWFVEEGHNG